MTEAERVAELVASRFCAAQPEEKIWSVLIRTLRVDFAVLGKKALAT